MQSDGSETLSPTTLRLQSLSAADTRGKHRIHAELKRFEQETRFLEVSVILFTVSVMVWEFDFVLCCWILMSYVSFLSVIGCMCR